MDGQMTHDDMIPRITIRDWEDGETIKTAILIMGRTVQSDYARAASSPGADQFALTVEMNKRIESLMQLIRGAFVDIGVKQDGLVHVSELSDKFVKNPTDVVAVGDIVEVRVKEVDLARKRIALSMKKEISDGAPSKPVRNGEGKKPVKKDLPKKETVNENFTNNALRDSLIKAGFKVK